MKLHVILLLIVAISIFITGNGASLMNTPQKANRRYIGYPVMARDSIPCSLKGGTSKNCRPGPAANPYRRGCSAVMRCRGGGQKLELTYRICPSQIYKDSSVGPSNLCLYQNKSFYFSILSKFVLNCTISVPFCSIYVLLCYSL